MDETSRGSRYHVISAGEGASFWQPSPADGYVTVLASPWNMPGLPFSQGIQCLPSGAHVRGHSHAAEEEVIFCLEGKGRAEIESASYPLVPGTTLVIGRGARHTFHNEGPGELRFLWTIAGPGLEEFFRSIGRPRQTSEAPPAPFERPAGPQIDEAHGLSASARRDLPPGK